MAYLRQTGEADEAEVVGFSQLFVISHDDAFERETDHVTGWVRRTASAGWRRRDVLPVTGNE